MKYFEAKSEFNFMNEFRSDVFELWKIEASVHHEIANEYYYDLSIPSERQKTIQAYSSRKDGYQEIRERVSKGILKAIKIGYKRNVNLQVKSFPAPMVGGAIIPQNILMAIIADCTHGGIEKQMILDSINMILGACEENLESERKKLFNPLNWIKELLTFILRIPFMIVAATGFDVSKIEDNLFAKLFKVAEVVLIVYALYKLGFGQDKLAEAIKEIFTK